MAKSRAVVAFGTILLCLIASSIVYQQPAKAQSLTNITINKDGSVTPTSAPITRTGGIYTLTSNINGSIEIDRSSITFNGNGNTINGGTEILPAGEEFGIILGNVTNVTVTNTTITNTGIGVQAMFYATAAVDIEGGGSNIITGNNMSNNYNAIRLLKSNNNLIVANNITDNHNPYSDNPALMIWSSSNNTIYHNNFINNTSSAGDANDEGAPFSGNTWDNGYPSGGNFWSDYQTRYPNATEIDNSGIGNTPYVIDSQNKDLYPLTQAFDSSFLVNYEQEIIPPAVSVVSPLNETYSGTNVSLSFSIDKSFNWVGYSLDGQDNVTVNGNTTIPNVAYGSHTVTVYANSTFGVISASRTVDFNIAKSEPFTSIIVMLVSVTVIAIVVGLAAAILYRRRRQRKNSNLNMQTFLSQATTYS